MSKHKATAFKNPAEFSDPIQDLIRSGARQLIQSAIEAELQSLLNIYQDEQTVADHRSAVHNGYLPNAYWKKGDAAGFFGNPRQRIEMNLIRS